MGFKLKTVSLASAGLMISVSVSAAENFPVDSKAPAAVIETISGVGTSDAKVFAKITKQSVVNWCENWRPEDKDCVKDNDAEIGKTYTASADCHNGTLTDPFNQAVKFAGIHRGTDFNRFYQFADVKTNKKIGFSNADGGATIMSQWLALCPYGLPYSILPLTDTVDIFDEQKYNAVRQQEGVASFEFVGHNKREFKLDNDLGTITYSDRVSETIPENRVLFRGSISLDLGIPSRGMAYVFKKGCEAAPYYVDGYYNADKGQLVLEGEAPVREGCKVTSYTKKSKNSKLVFQFRE